MFGALAVALQSPNYDDERAGELYNVTHKPMADGLELLPKPYAELKPKLGPPLPGDFAHFKTIIKLDRLRLRGSTGANDEFLRAATAQNLRKMAKLYMNGLKMSTA